MARLLLSAGETFGIIGGHTLTTVFGSAQSETVLLAPDADVVFDSSFAGGGDNIEFAGSASLYTASISGSNVVLTSADGANIVIPIGTAGTTINFPDGDTRTLQLVDGQVMLGDQEITGTPAPIGEELSVPEALEALRAAREAADDAEEAYAGAVVEAGLENDPANFDLSTNDYLAQAEAAVQGATGALASARATVGSDAQVNAAVAQAQQVVNTYDFERFDEQGWVATGGTTYSLAQLQTRAINAQAALDADIAASGELDDLVQQLEDSVLLYVSQHGDGTRFNDLNAAINAYQADPTDANAADIFTEVDALDTSGAVAGPRLDSVEARLEAVEARGELTGAAADWSDAFNEAENHVAFTHDDFDVVNFVGGANDLTSALAVQAGRTQLVDNVSAAQENQAAVQAADADYASAQQAVANAEEQLGYAIQDIEAQLSLTATAESDLFIFDAEAAAPEIAINALQGDDVILLGGEYSLGTGAGDNNILEIFLTEVNGNAVLQIENTPFGSVGDDFTEITLTGVDMANVNFDSGVITFG